MAAREFKHFGVPTHTEQSNEQFIDGAKVYVTNPDDDPFCVEFLRFAPDSPMPKEIQTQPHAAFLVPSLEQELAGKMYLFRHLMRLRNCVVHSSSMGMPSLS